MLHVTDQGQSNQMDSWVNKMGEGEEVGSASFRTPSSKVWNSALGRVPFLL